VLAANKHEGKAGDAGYMEAFSLGLGEPVAISAEHGEGMSELYAAIVAALPSAQDGGEEEAGAERPIHLAFIGRPNAGKSTLANALLGEDRLLVGPEAGITRDAISVDWEWRGKKFRLVDTAGMRRKAKVQARLEKLSVGDSLNAIRFADVCVLVMDAGQAFEQQDLAIADLVVREGRALVLALAKWDAVEDTRAHAEEMKLVAREKLPQARGAPLVTIAAIAGVGLDRLMKGVMDAHRDWNARVKTSDLNN
jgi:GTP-binding protein